MAKKEQNLKDMKADELKTKLKEIQESLRVLNFNKEGAKSKNVKEIANLKKEIARILTEMNKKAKNK